MPMLQRTGKYRAEIMDYSLEEKDSGAVAIACKFRVLQAFSDGEWYEDASTDEGTIPWVDYDLHVYGRQYIVKKDGSLNFDGHESFMRATGWDGVFDSIIDKTFQPWPCQITVEEEVFEGKPQIRVAWINHWDDAASSGMKQLEESRAKALKDRFGAQLRAKAAAIKASMPAKPAYEPPVAANANGDGIPF